MSSWALLAIAGAALWATSNVLDKIILSKWIKDPRINILALGVVSMVVGAGALLTGSATFGPTTLFVLNLAAGTIYVGAAWVYYRAVIIEEISRVVPLFYISPVIVGLLSAVFFHEQLGSYAYLGVLLLVAGAILVGSHELRSLRFSKGFWWMILSAFLFAASFILNAATVDQLGFWNVYTQTRIGFVLALLPLVPSGLRAIQQLRKRSGIGPFWVAAGSESIGLAGTLLFTAAFGLASVTLVNALASVQPFFVLLITTLLSWWLPDVLKEELSSSILIQKALGIVALVVGAYLVT